MTLGKLHFLFDSQFLSSVYRENVWHIVIQQMEAVPAEHLSLGHF